MRKRPESAVGGAMLDILIRGGTVIDGTGQPARRADVAIAGERIEAIGLLFTARAARVIDAAGHVVAPGFVDMHSHVDFVLPGCRRPIARSSRASPWRSSATAGRVRPRSRRPGAGRHRHLRPHPAGARLGLDDLPELPRRSDPSGDLDQRGPAGGTRDNSPPGHGGRAMRARART
jgi:Amidohydrolase family